MKNIFKVFHASLMTWIGTALLLVASVFGKVAHNGKQIVKTSKRYLRNEKALPLLTHMRISIIQKGLHNTKEKYDYRESRNNRIKKAVYLIVKKTKHKPYENKSISASDTE